jgi:hypothetical protein
MMDKRVQNLILLEILWWIVTAIIVYAVLYPIYNAIYEWPFKGWNIAYVVCLVTLTRYIFLLKHTFLARRQEVKVVLILLMFPFTFVLIDGLNGFMRFASEVTFEDLTGHLPGRQKLDMDAYLWNEMIFFAVGSIIAAPVFAGRLFMSIWRQRNRGTI